MWSRFHGGPVDDELRALGVDPARLLDVSASTNPYGPCPEVARAVRDAAIDRYPDPTGRAARQVLAGWLGVAPDELAVGNGAADLLWTLARALPHVGRPALIVEPTFCELRAALVAGDAQVVEWRATANDGFALDLDAIAATARAHDVGLVYLCTPGTPVGSIVPAAAIATWASELPRAHVICDQSFLSLSDRAADAAIPMPPNVVRVRSLTKDLGLPGVRIGYLIAAPAVVARVEACRPAWTTSAPALAAAIAAPAAAPFVAASRDRLLADRAALDRDLRDLGLAALPSAAPFLAVAVPDAPRLRRRLLARHHVLVRDCASFGMPGYLRLAARAAAERARVVSALAEELELHS